MLLREPDQSQELLTASAQCTTEEAEALALASATALVKKKVFDLLCGLSETERNVLTAMVLEDQRRARALGTGISMSGADCEPGDCSGADCTPPDCSGADCEPGDCSGADCEPGIRA